jgi:hypothetical protein
MPTVTPLRNWRGQSILPVILGRVTLRLPGILAPKIRQNKDLTVTVGACWARAKTVCVLQGQDRNSLACLWEERASVFLRLTLTFCTKSLEDKIDYWVLPTAPTRRKARGIGCSGLVPGLRAQGQSRLNPQVRESFPLCLWVRQSGPYSLQPPRPTVHTQRWLGISPLVFLACIRSPGFGKAGAVHDFSMVGGPIWGILPIHSLIHSGFTRQMCTCASKRWQCLPVVPWALSDGPTL